LELPSSDRPKRPVFPKLFDKPGAGKSGLVLRHLQAIRVGTLKIAGQDSKRLLTQIPPELNALLARLDLLPLFTQPPAWVEV
jgi:hypothetical protein